jgi:cytochrome c oxidase subunit 2
MSGIASVLDPQGPAAASVSELAWLLFLGGGAILVLVAAATAFALWGGPRVRAWLASDRFVVAAGIAFPVVALSALLLHLYAAGHSLDAPTPPALRVEVIGEQWWWRVRYLEPAGAHAFETANEIRLPAGVPVELTLSSADVIHSFWVPSLAGKIDMIPGRANRLVIVASKEGVYRGQCAEYCGGPHALMALHVMAQQADDFQAWRDAQRRPAVSADALFVERCGACHTVRGTAAAGRRGPDLTHVASRLTLAAGTLANTPDGLARWLADSQHVKPGNLMPAMRLSDAELRSLAAYVSSLR